MRVNDLEDADHNSREGSSELQFGLTRMFLAVAATGGALALFRGESSDGLYLAVRCIGAGGLFGAAIGIIFRHLLLWVLFGACAALASIIWVALGFRG